MNGLPYNSEIRSLLEDLASLDPEVGPEELCCLWFDSLYRPGEKHPELYNPGVWELGLREWRACFTDDELTVLSEFHSVFEAEVDALPTDWPDWAQDPGWQRVSDAARAALAKLRCPGAG